MAADDKDDGFLSRWSRRKVQVREGAALPEATLPAADSATLPVPLPPEPAAPEANAAPAPTLADVAELTPDSDYTRFVARSVQPDVRNAALKKLFTDPHFNIMDGLDTYIDDYGKPDPLPEGMLRLMNQAHALGLFSDEDNTEKPPETAAPAGTTTETMPDEDTDLRLQPHDDAGRPGPESGAGEDTGRQH